MQLKVCHNLSLVQHRNICESFYFRPYARYCLARQSLLRGKPRRTLTPTLSLSTGRGGKSDIKIEEQEMKIAVMPEDFLMVYGLYANAQSRIATEDIA